MIAGTPFDLIAEGRARFLELATDVRPELHRSCARMMGSVFDGEDVVQETLARAFFELPQLKEMPALRGWLFRIAHNCAMDRLRAEHRRKGLRDELQVEPVTLADAPDLQVDRVEELTVALSAFTRLPPQQRAAVILKDVVGLSLNDIGELLGCSVLAVKATLHRGRRALKTQTEETPVSTDHALARRYAQLFQARDWEAVRALLADDVRLDLVAKWKRDGREQVQSYYTNYTALSDWSARFGVLEGRPGVIVTTETGAYFVCIEGQARVTRITDYRYSAYVFAEVRFDSEG